MRKTALWMAVVVLVIFVAGMVMVFNTSSADVLDRALSKSTHHAVVRQMLYAVVGVGVCSLVWMIGYEGVVRRSGMVMAVLGVLLVMVFVPGVGVVRNGAHRWVGAVGVSFQPSEFVKIWLPLWAVGCLGGGVGFWKFVKFGLLALVPMVLVMAEPDNGTTAILGMSLLVVFWVVKVKLRYWLWPMMVLVVVGGLIAVQLPYVQGRLGVYINPEKDLLGKGHQPYQAKIAAGSGGLMGRGLGESMQKLAYLPEAQNDYIAAIYAEECGFVGVMGLVVMYSLIAYFGFRIACRAKDEMGYWVASVMVVLVCMQAFLNLGVVSGLMPSKGLNLPFFSQGGSSLIANLVAITLLMDVDRRARWADAVS